MPVVCCLSSVYLLCLLRFGCGFILWCGGVLCLRFAGLWVCYVNGLLFC